MPNKFSEKSKFSNFELSDIRPGFAIFKFIVISWLFHQFDKKKIQLVTKIFILLYVFFPLLGNTNPLSFININSNLFITNYFYSIIDTTKYDLLITLYLLAPLITLYFKEHGLIIDEFISNYKNDKKVELSSSLLDLNKDKYDTESLNCHISKILINERSLENYYLASKYIKWTRLIGEKRRKSFGDIRYKILIVVSLLIFGMPMSLSSSTSIYYMASLSIFVFIMLLILTQILYSGRSILKLSLLQSATDAAHKYYEEDQNKDEPFTS